MTNYLETGITITKEDGTYEVYMIPYNMNNILITEKDIIYILKQYGVVLNNINHINIFHDAFTHKSYVKKDIFSDTILECARSEMGDTTNLIELRPTSYERLEFLGDRVLKIIVSFYLFHRYTHEDEGFMTRLQAKIEDKKNLAIWSRELGLNKFFIISKQIENMNGRQMDKMHEDIFEAFLGALFNSNGFQICYLLIINLLETMIDYSDKLYCDNNYKDNLLRYNHRMKYPFPEYHMIGFEGPPHKRIYIMGVVKPTISVADKKIFIETQNYRELCISFGNGLSKKEGEQKAAKMALILYGSLNKDQYGMEDIYYPNFDNKINTNLDKIIVIEEPDVTLDSEFTDED